MQFRLTNRWTHFDYIISLTEEPQEENTEEPTDDNQDNKTQEENPT